MPIATKFNAIARGNGFPFCLIQNTDANINTLNGHQDINQFFGVDKVVEVFRIREVPIIEAMKFIWNLYSVSFPAADGDTGDPTNPQTFDSPAIFKYNTGVTDGYINAIAYVPYQRVCNEVLGFPVPRDVGPPRDDTPGGWFVAQTATNGNGYSAQFAIRSIYYATDTKKYYIAFTSSVRGDDDSFVREIPFDSLTFDYYTYA